MEFNFIGSIPHGIFNISTLKDLSLTSVGLGGSLPASMGHSLPLLERLALNMNNFEGSIPYSILHCSQLISIFALDHNRFTGSVSPSIGNLRLLKDLSLTENNLGIESPFLGLDFITSLTNCGSLNILAFGTNLLEGVIPKSIGNLSTSLKVIIANDCKIKGVIPTAIDNLSNLVMLVLSGNTLTDDFPLGIQRSHKPQGLYLTNNKMTGLILEGLCNLLNLFRIYIGQNRFLGPIPECLGNVTSLRYLNLKSNMLTSSIPECIWRIQDLIGIDLSLNSLTGLQSPEISN